MQDGGLAGGIAAMALYGSKKGVQFFQSGKNIGHYSGTQNIPKEPDTVRTENTGFKFTVIGHNERPVATVYSAEALGAALDRLTGKPGEAGQVKRWARIAGKSRVSNFTYCSGYKIKMEKSDISGEEASKADAEWLGQ